MTHRYLPPIAAEQVFNHLYQAMVKLFLLSPEQIEDVARSLEEPDLGADVEDHLFLKKIAVALRSYSQHSTDVAA